MQGAIQPILSMPNQRHPGALSKAIFLHMAHIPYRNLQPLRCRSSYILNTFRVSASNTNLGGEFQTSTSLFPHLPSNPSAILLESMPPGFWTLPQGKHVLPVCSLPPPHSFVYFNHVTPQPSLFQEKQLQPLQSLLIATILQPWQ